VAVPITVNEPPSKNLIRPILIVLLICFVIGLVAVAVRQQEAAYRARFATLPDGTLVELLGTGVDGTMFSTETKWEKIARRFLPNRFTQWLPPNSGGSVSFGSNSSVVCLHLNLTRKAGSPLPWAGYTTEDEAGFCYPGEGGYGTVGDPASGRQVQVLSLRSYPRRQREFLLHLTDNDGKTMATFSVTNPLPGPFPNWRPLPLPQTLTNGPVTLTLESLTEKTNRWGRYLSPKFHLNAADPAWVNARSPTHIVQDATGNEGSVLSPREPAWKLRTLVYRERPQDFATNEQFVLTNLPPPAPGQFLSLDQSVTCAGVGLKVLVLADAGTLRVSNGVTRFMVPGSTGSGGHSTSSSGLNTVETWDSSTPFLLIEARNAQPDDKIQVHISDDRGREVKVEMVGGGSSGGVRTYKPGFVAPPGATSFTVTVLVNRPLSFDFLVDPAQFGPKKD
jgi:hypothetical protein